MSNGRPLESVEPRHEGTAMKEITDEAMREMLGKAKSYTVLILKPGPRRGDPQANPIIREHARRNFQLRAEGLLSIVCPVGDSDLAGVGIFDAGLEEVDRLMKEDPAVQAGVLVYELHGCRSFPGDALR
jgi:hypothetical protein